MMVTMALSPAQKRQQLAEMAQSEEQFLATMNLINHENLPYEVKEANGQAYIALYPLWAWNAHMITEALEAINPRYEGMSKYLTCGLIFFVKRGELQECPDGALLKIDTYINTATGTRHTIEYSEVEAVRSTIAIDGAIIFSDNKRMRDLYAIGENRLLAQLGVIPS